MCFSVMTTSHRSRFLSLLLCICVLCTAYYTLLCCDLFMGRVQRCDRSTVFQLCFNGMDLGRILWVGMDCKLSLSLCIQRCDFAPGQTSFISFAWFFGGNTSSGTYLRILQLHLHMLVHGCLDGSWLISCQSALSPLSIRPLSLQASHAFLFMLQPVKGMCTVSDRAVPVLSACLHVVWSFDLYRFLHCRNFYLA